MTAKFGLAVSVYVQRISAWRQNITVYTLLSIGKFHLHKNRRRLILSTSTPPEFIRWLDGQLGNRGWSDNQLAKAAKINSGTVSRVRSGTSPGFDVCVAIADALKVPPEMVLRMVGLLPKQHGYNPKAEEMMGMFLEMGEEDQDEMLHMGRGKMERRKRGKNGKKQTERTRD